MKNKIETNGKREPKGWSEVASWYDGYVGQEGSDFQKTLIFPGVKKLLNLLESPKEHVSVLDLACGQGAFCRYLSSEKISMTGIDISDELVDMARKRNDKKNITYITGDVTKLVDGEGKLSGNLSEEGFDAVTVILAIQNIAHLTPVWKAVYRLLKSGGSLVIVMMHPHFRVPQGSSWNRNEKEKRQERVIWKYLRSHEVDIISHPGEENNTQKTTHFHRPLQAYVNTLGNAGLYIDHIEEWASNVGEQEGIRKEMLMEAKKEIPLFMAIRARKTGKRE